MRRVFDSGLVKLSIAMLFYINNKCKKKGSIKNTSKSFSLEESLYLKILLFINQILFINIEYGKSKVFIIKNEGSIFVKKS